MRTFPRMIRSWTRRSPAVRRWLAIGFSLVALGAALTVASLNASSGVSMARVTFTPHASVHVSHGSAGAEPIPPNDVETATEQIARQNSSFVHAMPPTRGSFMAVWQTVSGANGYRLDVATDSAFAHYVANYRDLDVGNVNAKIVAGLQPGTRYYYRVRAYSSAGSMTGGNSDVATAQTTSTNAGLVISPTFDTSILRNSKAGLIEAQINQAITLYQSLFSDPINVSILFRYANTSPNGQKLNGAIAQSFFVAYQVPWNDFVNALRADGRTANDASANASLPSFALTPNIHPSSAGGRAVGLDTPPAMSANGTVGPGLPYDGIVTLNSDVAIQFTRPPSSASFDGLTAIEHEMDEVLGLGSHLDPNITDLRPQDLFSFSGFATRNTSRSGIRYFSIDNGQTDIVNFNQVVGGDAGDWDSGTCPQTNPYVQNAFGCKGQFDDVSATSPEGISLDVIGYDLAIAPPPPIANAATDVTTSTFTANWTAVAGAIGYRLDVSSDSGFASFVPGYSNLDVGNVINATVSGLNVNVTYYYRVRAYNGFGTSGNSNVVNVFISSTPPTPTPTISPGADQSVTIRNNVLHDGNDPSSPLMPPLTLKWQHDFTPVGVARISYPLIAQGLVIVATFADSGTSIVALDEATGDQVWSVNLPTSGGFAGTAYDSGKVFVVNGNGLMDAFDAASGTLLWSFNLPGQYSFSAAPTAVGGTVFVGGAGSGGTLYAVNETNGNLLWTENVENGDVSSPAVNAGSVFVSYACPQSYAFAAVTGQLLWHYSGPCEGGGGTTPVVHLGRVYVGEAYFAPTGNLILDAQTGVPLGGFNSDQPAAFAGNLALYTSGGILQGVDLPSGQVLWTFAGDGGIASPPLIVNQTIYVGSMSGLLYGLDLQGNQVWSTQVGVPIGGQNSFPNSSLAAGDSLLVVPAGSILTAYGNGNVSPTPTPTASASPTATPTPASTPTPSPTSTPGPTLPPNAEAWDHYQHDTAHTGSSGAVVDPTTLTLIWRAPSEFANPVVVGSTVYATQRGAPNSALPVVISFDLYTGSTNWSYSDTFVSHTPAGVGGGFVVFAAQKIPSGVASLYVLDASSGHLLYTVPVTQDLFDDLMPTVVQNSGTTTVYLADINSVSAVSLGSSRGMVLWTGQGELGGFSMPTVVGNSVVLAGPGQYYAFDRTTGAMNHFHNGPISGGGGTTVAYDSARSQFYVSGFYDSGPPALSAYQYIDNDHINLLWQRTGDGVNYMASVAIRPDGHVYSAGENVIWELDPGTGIMLGSIHGSFSTSGVTPALTNGVLWAFSDAQTFAYDLRTLQLLQTFNGSKGSGQSPYTSPGALTNDYFLLDYGGGSGRQGFDVYAGVPNTTPTPTPTTTPTATPTPTPTSTPTPTPIPPTVNVSAFPTSVGKGGTATFTVFATSTGSQPIVVDYFMSGTAIQGFDYTLSPNQISIPAGQSSSSIELTVITSKTRGREKATMTLIQGAGYNLPASSGRRRSRSRPPQASITIQNR